MKIGEKWVCMVHFCVSLGHTKEIRDSIMTHTIDTKNWYAELYPDGTLSADPCPNCGSEGFFNCATVVGAQYAQKADETQNGEWDIDDMGFERFIHVVCGNCSEVLFNNM